MRPMQRIIGPPRFNLAPGIVDRQERVGIGTFVPQSAEPPQFRRHPMKVDNTETGRGSV